MLGTSLSHVLLLLVQILSSYSLTEAPKHKAYKCFRHGFVPHSALLMYVNHVCGRNFVSV